MDSLGIISRDLGRELSFNEFLYWFAPDNTELGHSPILPDAAHFVDDILYSHNPVLVQFSKIYQQTAIKWSLIHKDDSAYYSIAALRDKYFLSACNLELRKVDHDDRIINDFSMIAAILLRFAVAKIEGDAQNISIVKTQIVTICADESESARLWEKTKKGVLLCIEKRDVHKCVILGSMLSMIVSLLGITRSLRRDVRRKPRSIFRLWGQLVDEANAIMIELGLEGDLPKSLAIIANEYVFDASDYWRDWHRAEKKSSDYYDFDDPDIALIDFDDED